MKALIFAFSCLLFCTFGSNACKKEEDKIPTLDPLGVGLLRDKSLNEIKSILLGNWKVHYSSGGITGMIKTAFENASFRYLPNDSIYIVLSNMPNTSDKATFVRKKTVAGYDAWSMEFTLLNGIRNELIVDYKYYDTLMLAQNANDGVVFAMTKKP